MNRLASIVLAALLLTGTAEPVEPAEMVRPAAIESFPEKEFLGVFEATGYCSCEKCCGKWADGITYSGTVAEEGRTIAVDPDVIPLGSVVEISGHQYIAEDIGGGINGKEIDLFFADHRDAWNFGRQKHDVYLVK